MCALDITNILSSVLKFKPKHKAMLEYHVAFAVIV